MCHFLSFTKIICQHADEGRSMVRHSVKRLFLGHLTGVRKGLEKFCFSFYIPKGQSEIDLVLASFRALNCVVN